MGGYWITVTDSLFTGRYLAEMYLEATDGAWVVQTPFYSADYDRWFMDLFLYEGRVAFRYPSWWDAAPFPVHIAVLYPRR